MSSRDIRRALEIYAHLPSTTHYWSACHQINNIRCFLAPRVQALACNPYPSLWGLLQVTRYAAISRDGMVCWACFAAGRPFSCIPTCTWYEVFYSRERAVCYLWYFRVQLQFLSELYLGENSVLQLQRQSCELTNLSCSQLQATLHLIRSRRPYNAWRGAEPWST